MKRIPTKLLLLCAVYFMNCSSEAPVQPPTSSAPYRYGTISVTGVNQRILQSSNMDTIRVYLDSLVIKIDTKKIQFFEGYNPDGTHGKNPDFEIELK